LRRADLVTAGLALAVHAGFAIAVTRGGKHQPPPAPKPKPVMLEFNPKLPKPEPIAEAPKAPAAEEAPKPAVTARAPKARKVAMRAPAPPSERPAAAPAAAPVASKSPIYAVSMASPSGMGAAVSVAGAPGGTGPGGTGTGASGAMNAAGGKDGAYRPASVRDVGAMPEVDVDACGRAAKYPREAQLAGTEGDVKVRVSLTESGKVHAARVLSGPGNGLEAAAVEALKNRCKFKPATGRDGQPVAFVIQAYTFHFQLPR
jgi:protein TonB